MSPKYRASWAETFHFTKGNRKALSEILGRFDEEHVDTYLNKIEIHLMMLKFDWKTAGEIPAEPPAQTRAVLTKIAKHSRALHTALEELDMSGSLIALSTMISSLGRGDETIDYMINDLPLLYLCAEKAKEITLNSKRGRPTDDIEQNFIGFLGTQYLAILGKKPTYSRGSVFPRFVRTVLDIALPGNPHAARDNSKIVRAALKNAGIIK